MAAQLGHERFVGADRRIYFCTMVVVIRQCGVNLAQFQTMLSRDFVGVEAQPLVPDGNILHRDAMTGNVRFTAAHIGRHLNMSNHNGCHNILHLISAKT